MLSRKRPLGRKFAKTSNDFKLLRSDSMEEATPGYWTFTATHLLKCGVGEDDDDELDDEDERIGSSSLSRAR